MFNEHKPRPVVPHTPNSSTWRQRHPGLGKAAKISAGIGYNTAAILYVNKAPTPGGYKSPMAGRALRAGFVTAAPIAGYGTYKKLRARGGKKKK